MSRSVRHHPSGMVINHAYMHNAETIENRGRMENNGLLVNDGFIHNPDLGFVGIANRGAVENNDIVDNEGAISCACGAAWCGSGSVNVNPPEYEPCNPAVAIERLRNELIKLTAGNPGVRRGAVK